MSAGTSAQPRTGFPLSRQEQVFREETLGALCITLAGLWQADRDGLQGAFLQPIAPLLAKKATPQTARARLITDRRELCRGSLGKRGFIHVESWRLGWDGLQGGFCSNYREYLQENQRSRPPKQGDHEPR